MSDFLHEIRMLHERLAAAKVAAAEYDAEVERREDEGVDVREGLGNPDASFDAMAHSPRHTGEPFTGKEGPCWCQNAYDTGFTGNAKVDARLAYHYEGWLDPDCIRRDYDHYAKHIPYVEFSSRRPYCFKSKRQVRCNHEACEHARHRAPQTVKRMRHFIEQNCPATCHYWKLHDNELWGSLRIDRAQVGPEIFESEARLAAWDTVEYEHHKRNPQADGRAYDPEVCPRTRTRPVRLNVISRTQFFEDYADGLCLPVEYQVVCDFLVAHSGPVVQEPGEYTVTWLEDKAQDAALEAAAALYAEQDEAEEDQFWASLTKANVTPRVKALGV